MSTVYHTETLTETTYSLEPVEALIACHEQTVKHNGSTWTYKKPAEYPIIYRKNSAILGNLWVSLGN
jgi:hypothetical protein